MTPAVPCGDDPPSRHPRDLRGVHLADLDLDDPRWQAALPVLQQLRPQLTDDARRAVQDEGAAQGYTFTAAFDDAGRCLGVAGWRVLATAAFGRKLYVDDLVTAPTDRSTGVGRALLAELERQARDRYSTVTDLARLRGWSTSSPRAAATSAESTCSGTMVSSGASSDLVSGMRMRSSA